MQKIKIRGEFFILLTAILWSSSGILTKMTNVHPILLNGIRCFFAFIVVIIYCKFKIKINKFTILGAICFVVANLSFFVALKMTTAANAIVLQYSAPMFVLLECCIKDKKLPSFKNVIVLALAFVGIIIVVSSDLGTGNLVGNLLALLSGVAFSGIFFINKLEGSSPLDATLIGFLVSAIIGLFFINGVVTMIPLEWGIAIFLGVIQMGLAYILFCKGLKTCSSFTSSIISTLEVALNPLLVFIVLKEMPTIYTIIGGTMVVLAIILNLVFENHSEKKMKLIL